MKLENFASLEKSNFQVCVIILTIWMCDFSSWVLSTCWMGTVTRVTSKKAWKGKGARIQRTEKKPKRRSTHHNQRAWRACVVKSPFEVLYHHYLGIKIPFIPFHTKWNTCKYLRFLFVDEIIHNEYIRIHAPIVFYKISHPFIFVALVFCRIHRMSEMDGIRICITIWKVDEKIFCYYSIIRSIIYYADHEQWWLHLSLRLIQCGVRYIE